MSHVPSELRVLLIEDNPGDAELVRETLNDVGGASFAIHCAEALLPGLDRLAGGDIDLVLLDLSLPDSRGLDGLNAIRTHAPGVPVVLLTGMDNEALALQSVQIGAQDYLVKGTLDGPALARTLQHAVVRQRSQAAAAHTGSNKEQAKALGFLGVKGGVGCTTIACHVARELRRRTGGRVLLMDLGAGANAVAFLMNAGGPYSILDASNDILHLDHNRWEKLVASAGEGLDVIQSAGPAYREQQLPKAERVRFVLRFVRPLYKWIVADLGRLNPFSARMAEEVDSLYLASSCDVLALNEAKWAAHALRQAGFGGDRLALLLNQMPRRPVFTPDDLEKILGMSIVETLPECGQEFAESVMDGKRLGESRNFQKAVARVAARIAGSGKDVPPARTRFPFLTGALRDATAGG